MQQFEEMEFKSNLMERIFIMGTQISQNNLKGKKKDLLLSHLKIDCIYPRKKGEKMSIQRLAYKCFCQLYCNCPKLNSIECSSTK